MDLEHYLHYRNYQLFKQSPIHNFDLTIVVPVKDSYASLMQNYNVLSQNGIEVIFIVADGINKVNITSQMQQNPLGNWIVITYEINCMLSDVCYYITSQLIKKHILLINNVESLLLLTTVLLERIHSLGTYYTDHCININKQGFSGLLLNKKLLSNLVGFNKNDLFFTSEVLEIIKRTLELEGVKMISESDIEHTSDYHFTYFNQKNRFHISHIHPIIPEILYHYNNKNDDLLNSYLGQFESYTIYDRDANKKTFKKIVLVQTYNEIQYIRNFLNNMGEHFDGIILLDDSSVDGTYDLALHKKLLLKVKKKRTEFNDLENRNTLLALASFYKAEWLCFMDADEKIDSRFADFDLIENDPNIDVVAFNRVHLWNNESDYNASYPSSYSGVEKVFRMFRNIGFSRINTHKKYHFAATPYFEKSILNCGILMLHYGFLKKADREKKYNFYTKNDPLGTEPQYRYIISNDHIIKEVSNIHLSDLQNANPKIYIEKTS